MDNRTKINKPATVQKVKNWIKRKKINIPDFEKTMNGENWENELLKIAQGCGIEVVYRKELAELHPKPGEWYSVARRENMNDRYIVVVKEGELCYFAEDGLGTPTSNVFEPKPLSLDEAKKQIEQKLAEESDKSANAETKYLKEQYQDSFQAMKRFYEEHFRK